MADIITISNITIDVRKKNIKNVHLTVHPPDGRVRIVAPIRMQLDTIRLYAISKLRWIRRQQQAIRAQERETVREYVDCESHYVWGQRYLLKIIEQDAPPAVELEGNKLLLYVRPGMDDEQCQEVLSLWYRGQIREAVGPIIKKWENTLGVNVCGIFVQHMKTKWGSCNPTAATIRLNTELAKKPLECLEYVTLHEMVHICEPTHNERFVELMDRFMPGWTHRRDMLNRLPVRHEEWFY